MLFHNRQLERIIYQVKEINLRKPFYNKLRFVITIKLNIEYLVIKNYFSFFRKVYNFINIFIFSRFLKIKQDFTTCYTKKIYSTLLLLIISINLFTKYYIKSHLFQ